MLFFEGRDFAIILKLQVKECSFPPFQAIGAEYGEGFETFRMDGPLKVDVVSIHHHKLDSHIKYIYLVSKNISVMLTFVLNFLHVLGLS